MPIPTLFTSPATSTDLTKFGPDHWNTVTALLTALLDGPEADGTVLTRSAASATGGAWVAGAVGPAGPQGEIGPQGPEGPAGSGSDLSLFRLTDNLSAIGPTIADFFGPNSALATADNEIYELVFATKFLKTSSGAVTWTLTHTSAYANLVAQWESSTTAGIGTASGRQTAGIVAITSAAAALPATGVLGAANHDFVIRALVECGTAGNLRLRVTSSGGTVTPLRGSYYTARLIGAANVGTFVA